MDALPFECWTWQIQYEVHYQKLFSSENLGFKLRMHCKYLRSPSAITVVGMLDNRNILSIMHRMISS